MLQSGANITANAIIAGHFVTGGILAYLDRKPKEVATLVLGVEVLERSKWAAQFPTLFRPGGPFLSDVAATAAGYFIGLELMKK